MMKNETTITETKSLYTVSEVRAILRVSTGTVYTYINLGLLPAIKLGSLRVRRKALEEFLEKYEGYDLSNPKEIKSLPKIA
ncbi:MAG: helix-turn-helix domain-containing protein [Anaerovoracaceae bacterium]